MKLDYFQSLGLTDNKFWVDISLFIFILSPVLTGYYKFMYHDVHANFRTTKTVLIVLLSSEIKFYFYACFIVM